MFHLSNNHKSQSKKRDRAIICSNCTTLVSGPRNFSTFSRRCQFSAKTWSHIKCKQVQVHTHILHMWASCAYVRLNWLNDLADMCAACVFAIPHVNSNAQTRMLAHTFANRYDVDWRRSNVYLWPWLTYPLSDNYAHRICD